MNWYEAKQAEIYQNEVVEKAKQVEKHKNENIDNSNMLILGFDSGLQHFFAPEHKQEIIKLINEMKEPNVKNKVKRRSNDEHREVKQKKKCDKYETIKESETQKPQLQKKIVKKQKVREPEATVDANYTTEPEQKKSAPFGLKPHQFYHKEMLQHFFNAQKAKKRQYGLVLQENIKHSKRQNLEGNGSPAIENAVEVDSVKGEILDYYKEMYDDSEAETRMENDQDNDINGDNYDDQQKATLENDTVFELDKEGETCRLSNKVIFYIVLHSAAMSVWFGYMYNNFMVLFQQIVLGALGWLWEHNLRFRQYCRTQQRKNGHFQDMHLMTKYGNFL